MIATSTAGVPFTPQWRAGQDDAPVFLIRPASILERGQFEATLAGPPYNAGRVFPWDLAAAAEEAARALLDGEHLGQVLEALAAMRQTLDMDALPLEQKQLLTAIDPVLSDHWPEYAELRRRDARRAELLPTLAVKHFLKGWDWGDRAFTFGKDGLVSDETLRALGVFEMRAIGLEAYRLMNAEEQLPLSPPPSKSGPAPPTSPAEKPRRSVVKGGKSATVSGRKTRA